MNTAELRDLLRAKYTGDGWVLLEEVGNGTGGNRDRSCDAVAVGLWPSRGYERPGFEIKSDRGDWLRELKAPEKAEFHFTHTDYWWILAAEGVVKVDELPKGWGLLEGKSGGKVLRVKAKADRREALMGRAMLVALLQKAAIMGFNDKQELLRLRAQAKSDRERQLSGEIPTAVAVELSSLREKVKSWDRMIETFRQATGETFMTYFGGPPEYLAKEVGEVIRLLRGALMQKRRREDVERHITQILVKAEEHRKQLEVYEKSLLDLQTTMRTPVPEEAAT